MQFEFAAPTRIIFGPGTVRHVGGAARELGQRALLITGKSTQRAAGLLAALESAGVESRLLVAAGEPTVEFVREGAVFARREQCYLVIGFGGGSAIDAGKAIAAMMRNDGDVLDYLEVIGKAAPLAVLPAPFIAVPTTAGTGSEVTRNAVLGSREHLVKASLRSPLMLPRLAVVDPELTISLPPSVTATTGLDALTQLIEPYVSLRATPLTDGFCIEGLRRVARSLLRAYEVGTDLEARTDMSLASLLGGLALANAGLGVVHGFAAPAGGMFDAPHGALCAAILPHGMRANVQALRERAPACETLERCQAVARVLTGNAEAFAEDGLKWVSDLCRALNVAPLRSYGVREEDIPALAEKAARASSMKANPIALTAEELRRLAAAAL